MKKLLIVLLILIIINAGVWAYFRFFHVEDVGKVYLRVVSSAMLGDEEAFLDGFTKESRPIIGALMRLSRTHDPRLSQSHPYYFLVTEQIEDVEVDGEEAWLKLKRAGDRGVGTAYSVHMVKREGTWKVDALSFTGRERVVDKAY